MNKFLKWYIETMRNARYYTVNPDPMNKLLLQQSWVRLRAAKKALLKRGTK